MKFPYINKVLWQHVVLCKIALLGMRPAMVYVVRYVVREYVTHDVHHSRSYSQ